MLRRGSDEGNRIQLYEHRLEILRSVGVPFDMEVGIQRDKRGTLEYNTRAYD